MFRIKTILITPNSVKPCRNVRVFSVSRLYHTTLSFCLYLFKTYIMKKLIYLFLTVVIVGCSDDDGNPCLYNPTLTTSAVTNITETSATLNGVISIVLENCNSC